MGAALVIPAVIRYRDRFRNAAGFRRYLGIGLDSVTLLGRLSKNPKSGSYAFAGMTLYWAGEMFALWAGLAAFGTRMSIPVLIIADAVGIAGGSGLLHELEGGTSADG